MRGECENSPIREKLKRSVDSLTYCRDLPVSVTGLTKKPGLEQNKRKIKFVKSEKKILILCPRVKGKESGSCSSLKIRRKCAEKIRNHKKM